MKRSWAIWLAFAGCLSVALVAMGGVSWMALRLDEAEATARRRAALEENIRLALWRMDSALAPIVAQESARPPLAYQTFLPAGGTSAQIAPNKTGDAPLVPSPLLGERSPLILAHFQLEPDGRLTSPRVPSKEAYGLAVPRHLSPEAVETAKQALERIGAAEREALAVRLPPGETAPVDIVYAMPGTPEDRLVQQRRRLDVQRRGRGAVEFDQRNQAVLQSINNLVQSQVPTPFGQAPDATEIGGVPMTPLWLGEQLVLARRVVLGGRSCIQGCLLDWPAVKRWLLASVEDLLPEADLIPVEAVEPGAEARQLAALPARLVPGEVVLGHDRTASPVRLTLGVAWASVVVAGAAVAGLLGGVLRLSQRRAAFVSAVTHELRTPLTTFHLYTEMLADGMVSDPQARQEYLHTLRAEAARLSHLVENVLAYARLERGRTGGPAEPFRVAQLLEPIRGRLADRARQAGMELVVEGDDGVWARDVWAKPSALEQILLNLVDNACKYAAQATDKRIHLILADTGDAVEWRVRDHGPGLSRPPSRRLFRAFSKSAHEAANSAPGIGLGLALSTRLARDMGVRLWLDPSVTEGACFVLRLAVASPDY